MPRYSFYYANRKHHNRFKGKALGKINSYQAQRIYNLCAELKGRPNEKRVLEIADNRVREILHEDMEKGRIEDVDFKVEPLVPFSPEDREGKDIKITLARPERLCGKLIFLQVKSSRKGARVFRERHRSEIYVVVVGINKDPDRDRERIARYLAEIIRQELKTESNREASA